MTEVIIFNGKNFSQNILDNEVKPFADGKNLRLDIIWIGNSAESEVYVRHKEKAAQEVGIIVNVHRFPETASTDEILSLQEDLNKNTEVTGYFFQLPIPRQIDKARIFQNINPEKDVDGLNPLNLGLLCQSQSSFVPATAAAVMRILKEAALVDLEGKNIVIINDSIIVGRPLAALLLNEKSTVSVCTKYTGDLNLYTRDADIIITAVGKPGLITAEMIKNGAVLIDVGTRQKIFTENDEETIKIFGDIDFESCSEKAAFITPVPGGVGPATAACLLMNVCLARQREE